MNQGLADALLAYAKEECKIHGVEFIKTPGKNIKSGPSFVSGYFDQEPNPPVLKVATSKEWPLILAHELSHMFQWVENTPAWRDYSKVTVNLDDWLKGEIVNKKALHSTILKTINMERECEEKALALLESFGYNESTKYIQKANSYTLFYFYMEEHRTWMRPDRKPYRKPSIWKHFPDTFDIDLYETYKELKHLYDKCVYYKEI
jgi:hypothetical protein